MDNNAFSDYKKYYFKRHPGVNKMPIDAPYHPLIKAWMLMKRPMLNTLKERWEDFIIWFFDD